MKKRILALACAATLVLGMSLTVCAAGSPDTGSSANQATSGQSTSGQSTSSQSTSSQSDSSQAAREAEVQRRQEVLNTDNATGQVVTGALVEWFAEDTKIASGVAGAKINPVTDNNTSKAMLAEANRIVSGSTAFIASLVDLEVPAGTGAATFTLTCSNVWRGQNVKILHMKSDGTFEVITPSSVENNAVTFTMTSYSPIAIVIDDTTAYTSPKTADTGLAAGMLIAVLAMAGAVTVAACKRKVME